MPKYLFSGCSWGAFSPRPGLLWLAAVPREEPHLPVPRGFSVNLISPIAILGTYIHLTLGLLLRQLGSTAFTKV
jgi:hypothetical protein